MSKTEIKLDVDLNEFETLESEYLALSNQRNKLQNIVEREITRLKEDSAILDWLEGNLTEKWGNLGEGNIEIVWLDKNKQLNLTKGINLRDCVRKAAQEKESRENNES